MVFTQEANQEAEKLINDKKYFVDTKGRLLRVVENEAYLTFYSMTKY